MPSAKQQRLLVEPLYSTKPIDPPFLADANVGLFYAVKASPIVPDVFLSLGVQAPSDWTRKENRSYFFWEFGKPPEVAIEIVSNREGNELDHKFLKYAQIGVAYYIVFDPLRQLPVPEGMVGDGAEELLRAYVLTGSRYVALSPPFWLEGIGLGLTLWQGQFEDVPGQWLRWCDRQGNIIPTGGERAAQAEAKAEALAARLRELGVDPDEIE